jgi:hypothetical protein
LAQSTKGVDEGMARLYNLQQEVFMAGLSDTQMEPPPSMNRAKCVEAIGKGTRVFFSLDNFDMDVIEGLYKNSFEMNGLEPIAALNRFIKKAKTKKKGVKGIAKNYATLASYIDDRPRLSRKDKQTLKTFTTAVSYDTAHFNGVKFQTKRYCKTVKTDNSGNQLLVRSQTPSLVAPTNT